MCSVVIQSPDLWSRLDSEAVVTVQCMEYVVYMYVHVVN